MTYMLYCYLNNQGFSIMMTYVSLANLYLLSSSPCSSIGAAYIMLTKVSNAAVAKNFFIVVSNAAVAKNFFIVV